MAAAEPDCSSMGEGVELAAAEVEEVEEEADSELAESAPKGFNSASASSSSKRRKRASNDLRFQRQTRARTNIREKNQQNRMVNSHRNERGRGVHEF